VRRRPRSLTVGASIPGCSGAACVFHDQVTSAQIRKMLKHQDSSAPARMALLFSYSGAPWVRVTGDQHDENTTAAP
jgi:hypothetical protein